MLINCKDQFNDESLNELCQALNEGKNVQIHIDCTSPELDAIHSSHYASELYSIFGDKLQRIKNDTCYHSYTLRNDKDV